MSVHVYGLPGCTTVRKARKWLDAEGIAHDFTAFEAADDLAADLDRWIERAGLDTVLNTRATTFKALPEADRETLPQDRAAAIAAMQADPRLIKRPVLEAGDTVLTGFREADWRAAL
ncbi:ArsC/Spx/MgsR family protein [Roseobacter sp. HKCCA0434]|uniref:ArsC/Spx/MgsR family protein n=1 Tax=Roseobacter sp. HKCCA0434 TaxID=3079297 RepID=UPI002905D0A8|nr:ArsC/Spx/MgsR family protein [Roseobacter sp. HKCCA0434]